MDGQTPFDGTRFSVNHRNRMNNMSQALGADHRSALDFQGARGALSPGNQTGTVHGGGSNRFQGGFGDNFNNKTGAPVNYVMQPEEDDRMNEHSDE